MFLKISLDTLATPLRKDEMSLQKKFIRTKEVFGYKCELFTKKLD